MNKIYKILLLIPFIITSCRFKELDNKIEIGVALAHSAPVGADTMEDFVAIKNIMEYKT